MERGTDIRKNREQDIHKEKDNAPFMQVDQHSDPFTNFIANLKRQFKKAEGLGLGRLFGGKRAEPPKQPAEPESVIGATKTVMRSDFKNDEKSQAVQTGKKPALKIDNSIKMPGSPEKQETKAGIIAGYLASERQRIPFNTTFEQPLSAAFTFEV